jgi:predicted DNA-binding protein (MmcQ/YjbR family)
VTEDIKWGHDLVFSVGGKMFAGFQLPAGQPFGFKVDPAVFSAMTSRKGIEPAPYAARFHWVSIATRETLSLKAAKELLAESHQLVAEKLPKKVRLKLGLAEPRQMSRRRG